MSSVYGKMDDCRISDLVCSHGLIEVQCHTGIEKIPGSQQMLHMIPLQQTKGLPELRLKSKGGYVKTKLGVEWSCPTIPISFNWWLCDYGESDSYLRSHA